jgi:hypothetical protein
MRAIIIPANVGEPVREATIDGYEDLSAAVGGFLQALGYPGRADAVAYINEEGKLEGLPYNLRATVLLMTPAMGYMSGDYIAGDAVLIGANPMGEDLDLPADITVDFYGTRSEYGVSENCPTCGQPDNCGDCDHTTAAK